MTDLYPDEEGYICDGHIIGFCKAVAAIALHSAVFLGVTAVSGVVSVVAGAADGDSVGVALKAASANDFIPVAFQGVVKMVAGAAITAGQWCMNDASATYVLPIGNLATGNAVPTFASDNGTGTAHKLGQALQNGAASGDEFLLYLRSA